MTYKRTLLCEPDAILFALMLNKSVKGQNPPHASLAPLSIFFCDVISDVILLWVGGLLELLYYNYNAIYRILLHIMQQIIERAIQLFKKIYIFFFINGEFCQKWAKYKQNFMMTLESYNLSTLK